MSNAECIESLTKCLIEYRDFKIHFIDAIRLGESRTFRDREMFADRRKDGVLTIHATAENKATITFHFEEWK